MTSISKIASDFVKANKNYLSILQSFDEIAKSNTQSVIVKIVGEDGSIKQYELPSLGYLVTEIRRVSNNIDNITGNGSGGASVVLSDGTVTNLYKYQVPSVPEPISIDQTPVLFKSKFYDIHDKLLLPSLVVNLDVTSSLSINDKHVMVKRLSFTSFDDVSRNLIDNNIVGVPYKYVDLINTLENANIEYDDKEYNVDIDNGSAKLYGKFAVINFVERQLEISENGVSTSVNRLVYRMDTLKYSNEEAGTESYLKAGDILYLIPENGEIPDTDYKVTYVDINTNEIVLKINNGSSPPRRGTNVFGISPKTQFNASISVPVYPNQYTAIYIKRINTSTNITGNDWGNSLPFNTNGLVNSDGISIIDYHRDSVVDLRQAMISLGQQGNKPIIESLQPTVPILEVENLRVERINDHLSDVRDSDEISQMLSTTQKLKSEISAIDDEISSNNKKLRVTGGLTTEDKSRMEKSVSTKKTVKQEKIQELKSTVETLVSKSTTTSEVKAKYRIRGFWDIPNPITNGDEEIDIISFEYRYRYLRTDETGLKSSEFKVKNSGGGEQRANFSTWTERKNPFKNRILDEDSGKYIWEDQTLVGEEININQLDISISPNEKVEIQIKSVSELGYPGSPLKSDWSKSVIVEFPEILNNDDKSLVSKISAESTRVDIIEYLSNQGILDHVGDTITINGKVYNHDSKNIISPILTEENLPKDVSSVLLDYQSRIKTLESLISGSTAEMKISVVDGQGNVLSLVNNSDTVEIFSGYYSEQVAQLPVPKGEVVTKNYFILIENLSEIDLELLGYVPGSPEEKVPSSNTYDGYIDNIYEYFNYRKYWQAPIYFNNNSRDDLLLTHHTEQQAPYRQVSGYQSSQHKSQLLNIRSRDLSLNDKLYVIPPEGESQIFTINTNGEPTEYVWGLERTNPNVIGDGPLSNFCVHKDHPYLQVDNYFMDNYLELFNGNFVPNQNVLLDDIVYPPFYHSRYFNLKATEEFGSSQLGYRQYAKVADGSTATFDNFPRKMGFTREDKYLIGSNTVGSYLYMSVGSNNSLYTGSNIYNSGLIIKKGDSFAMKIPITFQYRMTDYNGPSDGGVGILGGYGSQRVRNLTYSKKLGVDILLSNKSLFSFDIKCTAKYRPNNLGNTESTDSNG